MNIQKLKSAIDDFSKNRKIILCIIMKIGLREKNEKFFINPSQNFYER